MIKLPKFNNNGKMVFNCIDWGKDSDSEKLHPTQKPVKLLKKLIEIFTDKGEIVIDPTAGSGSTLVAALELGRSAYGFEIDKRFYKKASKWIKETQLKYEEIKTLRYAKTAISRKHPILF